MSNCLTVREKEQLRDRISARIDKRIDALKAEDSQFMELVKSQARNEALKSAGLLKLQRIVDKLSQQREEISDKIEDLNDEVLEKQEAIDAKLEPKLDELDQQIEPLESQKRQHRDRAENQKRLVEERIEPTQNELKTQSEKLDSDRTQAFRKMLAIVNGVRLRVVESRPYRPQEDIDHHIGPQAERNIDKILARSDRGRKMLALREEKENLLDTVWLATSGKQVKELWEKVEALLGNTQTKLQKEAMAIEPVEED